MWLNTGERRVRPRGGSEVYICVAVLVQLHYMQKCAIKPLIYEPLGNRAVRKSEIFIVIIITSCLIMPYVKHIEF